MTDTKPQIRTKAEIQNLKDGWKKDPCWDIEHTEGFEAHEAELKLFSDECEKEWEQKRIARKEEAAKAWAIPFEKYHEAAIAHGKAIAEKDNAKKLMLHYLSELPMNIDSDCRVEIKEIVDSIIDSAVAQVKFDLIKSGKL